MLTCEPVHDLRESWLTAGVALLRPWFDRAGASVSVPLRVSCSFPTRRGLAAKNRVVGQCVYGEASADGTTELLISPVLDDPAEVLGTLAHEMAHAALPKGVGHKAPFAKLAKQLDLEGPAKSAGAGEAFKARAAAILATLGPLPHARITASDLETIRKPGEGRMLKAACPVCGYTVRVTRKWLDVGAPVCPTDAVPLEEGK